MAPDRSAAWRVGAIAALGCLLFATVVARRLVVSTYRADLETICFAETRSGRSLDESLAVVTRWVRERLTTPEGNAFYGELGLAPFEERGSRLEREAAAQGITRCPLVASLRRVAAEAEYRSDLQHLCSSVTFPGLREADDDGRFSLLDGWIGAQRRSARTGELGDLLRQSAPEDRPRRLRDAARAAGILSCEIARWLEAPVPTDAAVPPDAAASEADAAAR
jgi:hypothetical protein